MHHQLVAAAMLLLQHPVTRQFLCLVLWSSVSLTLLLLNRVLLHYSVFQMPCFLALGFVGFAMLAGRVLLYLPGSHDPLFAQSSMGVWRHVMTVGAFMGASAALSNGALQLLPIPAVVCLQAASPAFSYAILVALRQRQLHLQQTLQALLVLSGVGMAVWPAWQDLSTTGLVLQGAGTLLEAIWSSMHLSTVKPSTETCHRRVHACTAQTAEPSSQKVLGSKPGSSKLQKVFQEASPLVLLADAAPAAVVVLALPTALTDGIYLERGKYRYRTMLPAAAVSCVLACCAGLFHFEPGVLQALAAEPLGVLARLMRDVLVALAAWRALNEGFTEAQWCGYAIAQVAAVALCWSSSQTLLTTSARNGVYGHGRPKLMQSHGHQR